jgi:hypothetical protein
VRAALWAGTTTRSKIHSAMKLGAPGNKPRAHIEDHLILPTLALRATNNIFVPVSPQYEYGRIRP